MIAAASLARLVVTSFWLLAAAYAFLTSVPFAYEQFVGPRLVPGLGEFAEWHRWIAPGLMPVAWLGLAPWLANARAHLVARVTLGVVALAGIGLPLVPPLAHFESARGSRPSRR